MPDYDKSLVVYHQRFSIATESYRGLRTNLLFLKSKDKEKLKTITVTSARSWEGKSVTASNIALALSQSKHKTLLVDADMRKPRVHDIYGLQCQDGLISLLEGSKKFEECVKQSGFEKLDIITGEDREVDPTEILSSKALDEFIDKASLIYDFIIFDTPPVGIFTDTSLVASKTQNVLFVVSEGVATIGELKNAKKNLDNVGAKILGVIYNRAESKVDNYGYYYDNKGKKSVIKNILKKLKDNSVNIK